MERLGQKLKSGELKDIVAIPTSIRTKEQAESLGIPLVTLDTHSGQTPRPTTPFYTALERRVSRTLSCVWLQCWTWRSTVLMRWTLPSTWSRAVGALCSGRRWSRCVD